jgi:hypothetical protein
MRILYKFLFLLIKKLRPLISKLNNFLNFQEMNIQRKYQNVCKHRHLKETEFLGSVLYICNDCKAHGNLEYMKNKSK